jgi:peptidoglycan/LPS O-acetylase OafA/YrhL
LFIEAGVLAVDSFFFIGGFLVSYSILKDVKIKSRFRYFLAIINRYLRLIPAYFLTILIYYSILAHLVSGPFWFQNTPSI